MTLPDYFARTLVPVLLILLVFGGCQAVQDARPRNVGEGILLANAMITQAADSIAALARQDLIPGDVAEDQAGRLREAASQVDAAQQAYLVYRLATRPTDASEDALTEAETQLEKALATARAVQAYAETWK